MKIVITNSSMMYNRGSEAVIRSIVYICRFWCPDSKIIVVTGYEGEVLKNVYDADKIVARYDAAGELRHLIREVEDADVVLVTGADNYDYGVLNRSMTEANDVIFSHTKAKTILYDCSQNIDNISQSLCEDIGRFSAFTVRETETERNFVKYFGRERVFYFPDPAFVMPMEKVPLPFGFEESNTIGINISNLIMGKKFGAPEDIVLANYKGVIDYILDNTSYNVLFIQHVINNGYDLEATRKLYSFYDTNKRVSILQSELLNAMQVKYIISKLSFLITARTHASIAAYSTIVPTLVVGYSVKAIGIANDIFGENERYVIPVRSMINENDLLNKFIYILEHENEIKEHLREIIPEYKIKALMFGSILSRNRNFL